MQHKASQIVDNVLNEGLHKQAAKFEDLSYEAQVQYLKQHPASKKRLTKSPGDGGVSIDDAKKELAQKKLEMKKEDVSGSATSGVQIKKDKDGTFAEVGGYNVIPIDTDMDDSEVEPTLNDLFAGKLPTKSSNFSVELNSDDEFPPFEALFRSMPRDTKKLGDWFRQRADALEKGSMSPKEMKNLGLHVDPDDEDYEDYERVVDPEIRIPFGDGRDYFTVEEGEMTLNSHDPEENRKMAGFFDQIGKANVGVEFFY